MDDGCRETLMRLFPGKTETVCPPQADTKTRPVLSTTTAYGYLPVAYRCRIRCDAMSTSASESPRFSATHSVLPSGETPMPAGYRVPPGSDHWRPAFAAAARSLALSGLGCRMMLSVSVPPSYRQA